ncbi:preprotein translocase subunit SecA [Sedimentibacter saalensis]|uniref:Protein translocase subunit SecA n=2 Tax=root TaxID=1 RepID=A0A562IZX3_9FIRM|nr:preprotein translocase subunit SecA [Sedimentibacter saalensis]MEA5096889.1 preprotein translocase subunit SecA [Sedimentibacter saalensis]TWH76423.1 protein translocase subunit secA [Sedimentibacter saalensis]
MKNFLEKIFGSYSEKEVKRLFPSVDKIMSLEKTMEALTDNELKAKTAEFKQRLANGETKDDILPEAFAVVREAAWRVLGQKHYRVQLIGGMVLHQGRIAEMKTGEGKTLVSTLPVYLNALDGNGVHVITVNDYLAKRDCDWMGKVHNFLGLSVGCIVHGITKEERKRAYQCDITYGTNNEFGFDYLRDNMVIRKEEMVQRDLSYCIIDEVDSILIDEARTPLIISGEGDESTSLYEAANSFVIPLKGKIQLPEEKKSKMDYMMGDVDEDDTVDYIVDEKGKNVTLTARGITKAERFFNISNLADQENMEISHHINQALKAHNTMKRDIDYIVKDGEVLIVDEFTGRIMYGRRYSNGLHQAIEAKERIEVRKESKTLATITFQNYFRMYKKLSGMTGTAKTEEGEFREIYNVDVIEIPTNKDVIRNDMQDVVYKGEAGKFNAVINEIIEKNKTGQPILVGTISIEKSELLSKMLKKQGVKHEVLNAKQHDKEAEIVAQAGRLGSVTIATNMAGRGTDIVLGGNPEFIAKHKMKMKGYSEELISHADGFNDTDDVEIIEARETYKKLLEESKNELKDEQQRVRDAGGLHIIGTERHESRRIDNQLRGRAGRQGDPGSTRFYISLEDDLMRLFAGDKVKGIIETLKMPEDEPLEAGMLTRTIETAQGRVEGRNFEIRKHVLQYDNVMNKQREVIYSERKRVLLGEDLKDYVSKMVDSLIDKGIQMYTTDERYSDNWDIKAYEKYIAETFYMLISFDGEENITKEILKEKARNAVDRHYERQEAEFGAEIFREVERIILLRNVDTKWIDHIDAMDQLRQGIGLRAIGNEDPVRAYQVEGFDMFEEMTASIQEDTVKMLMRVKPQEKVQRKEVAKITGTSGGDLGGTGKPQPVVKKDKKVGRNDPCPCGSGKKYKKCCGANEEE